MTVNPATQKAAPGGLLELSLGNIEKSCPKNMYIVELQ
jgi:hypothetical protein